MAQNPLQGLQVVSAYRTTKFNKFFKFVDADNDGVISKEDFELAVKNMARLSGAAPKEADNTLTMARYWWDVLRAEKGLDAKIPISQAVQETLTYFTRTDPTKVFQDTRTTQQESFNLIDQNKDGFISPKEFNIFYKSFGFHEEDIIRNIFKRIDKNRDGLISREEYVQACCAFWLSDDPESGCGFMYDLHQ